MKWIRVTDQLPEIGQKVWYFFEYVGVWPGKYDGIAKDFSYANSKFPMTSFSGPGGGLTGDVTHWMPRDTEGGEWIETPEHPRFKRRFEISKDCPKGPPEEEIEAIHKEFFNYEDPSDTTV